MEAKPKNKSAPLFEKAVVAWMKYDPFVALAVQNDNLVRRDIMLNLLGAEVASRHFGAFPPRRPGDGPIYPETVRNEILAALHDPNKRTRLIAKLIFWATDPRINNRNDKSHLTRMQITSDLLGPIWFNATLKQEETIILGLKFLLAGKPTAGGSRGEQSYIVRKNLLMKVIDLLIQNQKFIINKTIKETEEKMRVHLLRQIQQLQGEKHTTPVFDSETRLKTHKLVKEKFPLRHDIVKQLEEIVAFFVACNSPYLRAIAKDGLAKLKEIRHPFTLTAKD